MNTLKKIGTALGTILLWLCVIAAFLAIIFGPVILRAQVVAGVADPGPQQTVAVAGVADPGPQDNIDAFNMLLAMGKQIINSPASLLVIIGLSILAWLIEITPKVNSKFIPHICIALGALSYWMFSPVTSVPAGFPKPHAVLVVNGIVCGFVAFIAHWRILKFVRTRNGNTEFIDKSGK